MPEPRDESAVATESAPPSTLLEGVDADVTLTTGRIARETAIALAVGLVAAIVLTWPLLIKAGHIAHDPFDPRFQAWTIDWVQHALTSGHSIFNANIFAPEPNTLAYSDSLLGIAIPLLPLRWLGVSPIAQLNIALLLGFATSAASGYLFGRVVTRSVTVGAITGAAFAFGPFGTLSSGALHATAHAGVGVAAAAAWWLADRAEAERDLGARRPLLGPAALLTAALVWQASVSFYPGAYAFAATVLVLLVRIRAFRRREYLYLAGSLGVALLCTLALAIPYLQVRDDQPTFRRTLAEVPAFSADFGTTDPRLSVWGPILGDGGDEWPVFGEPAFPGLVLLVLAPFGVVAGWRAGRRAKRAVITGGVLIAGGAVLAIGAGPTGWRRFLPYRLLFDHVPGFEALRAVGRAWIIGLLGLGLLAGLGAVVIGRWLATRMQRPARTVTAVVAAVAVVVFLVEGFAPWTDRPEVRVPKVDQVLADRSESGGVLYLPALEEGPLAETYSGFKQAENIYATTEHHRATPNGYSGFAPPSWKKLSVAMRSLPDADAMDRLRARGVRFVVVRSWAHGGAWGNLLDPDLAKPLRLIGDFDGDLLYEVPKAP